MNTKIIRTKALLTQQEFANVLGVHIETVRAWEKGKFKPSFKVQRKIKQYCEEHNIEIN